jgi:hypothetical protein
MDQRLDKDPRQEAEDTINLSSLLHSIWLTYASWAENVSSSCEVNKLNTFISPPSVPIAIRFWF